MNVPAINWIKFEAWHNLIPFIGQTDGWIFRGQRAYEKPALQPSLERAAAVLKEPPSTIERRTLREFKRRAQLSEERMLPDDRDIFQWLALLQHYGAPTRLLDFTHSLFVALFFAVERSNGDSEIWCVRPSSLGQKLQPPWSGNKNTALRYLLEPEKGAIPPGTAPVPSTVFFDEPFFMNRRLALQQGCFLCYFDVARSFEENLYSSATGLRGGEGVPLGDFMDYPKMLDLFRIVIPEAQHSGIRRQLRRMNMTREHLFPGLDGTAASFWQES